MSSANTNSNVNTYDTIDNKNNKYNTIDTKKNTANISVNNEKHLNNYFYLGASLTLTSILVFVIAIYLIKEISNNVVAVKSTCLLTYKKDYVQLVNTNTLKYYALYEYTEFKSKGKIEQIEVYYSNDNLINSYNKKKVNETEVECYKYNNDILSFNHNDFYGILYTIFVFAFTVFSCVLIVVWISILLKQPYNFINN